jgi:hypothetical protein
MDNVASASIKAFGTPSPKADFVSHSEQLITLTIGQLQDLITQAVEKAIQPLQDSVSSVEDRLTSLEEENATLRLKLVSVEQSQDTLGENQFIQLKLINGLKEDTHQDTAPSAGEAERIERIEKLCADAPGHMISLPELRGRLGIDKAVLSRLLKRIDRDRFYLKKSTTDKRIRYLCLLPVVR